MGKLGDENEALNLDLKLAIRSINHVTDQLCTARDDSYHRARAEAERDAYLKIIKEMYRGLLDEIVDLKT
jgi:ABC-type Zn uptake system ZnuABC Zn-binding protein ZnuA